MKIKIYDNNNIVVLHHQFNPFVNRKEWVGKKKKSCTDAKMTWKNYCKTIRRFQDKIYKLNLDSKKCWFLTLTLKTDIKWDDLISKFKVFMQSVKREFGEIGYIRSIEYQSQKRLHIHLILVFNSVVPKLDFKKINSFWAFGNVNYEKIDEVRGVADYICLEDSNCRDRQNDSFTLYPQGAKFLACSYNLPQAKIVKEIEIDNDKYDSLLGLHDEILLGGARPILQTGHYYDDERYGEQYCMDKTYIKSDKEKIETTLKFFEEDSP